MRSVGLLLAFAVLACAQDVLTNDSVLKMVKSGLGESLIVSMIQSQPGKYIVTPDSLVKLKQQGVSDLIMNAMVGKAAGNSSTAPQPIGANTADRTVGMDLPPGAEIGVYYKKAGQWEEMLPEVVNWKTGGVMKSIASAGIVKGDVNGRLVGPESRNSLTSPIEVVVDVPEGVAITEYQLLHLHREKGSREFRTVTGGVMHVSGGATRDVVPFEGKKVASRMYRVSLSNLPSGEYGFLPPGAFGSANSASIGKMYTFHVIE